MTELDSRYDDIDVDKILARVGTSKTYTFRRRLIFRAPEFTQRLPADETVEEGSTVTFACKVQGFPRPTVTWYKDDDVIDPESRAELTTGDNGVYSIKLQEVSKCDAGAYKVSATNLEGSSSSNLCITVKAKSKSRNRKKKKTRTVACAPLFPVIVEHEVEERRETLAAEQQDESPLTPLYSSISRKSPVTWPAFLGDWAYNREDGIHHDLDDLEIEHEDVFDVESDHPSELSVSATPSACASNSDGTHENATNDTKEQSVLDIHQTNHEHISGTGLNNKSLDNVHDISDTRDTECNASPVEQLKEIKPPNSLNLVRTVLENNTCLDKANDSDIINNNKDVEDAPTSSEKDKDISNTTENIVTVPPKEIEEKIIQYKSSEVSQIAVNRSYAKGNSTFSMATRSSPFRTVKGSSSPACNGAGVKPDTSTLQNMNNEILLQRMRKSKQCSSLVSLLTWTGRIEDHLAELILLICGCTFLALFFDLSPTTFVFDIIIALLVKLVVYFVFKRL